MRVELFESNTSNEGDNCRIGSKSENRVSDGSRKTSERVLERAMEDRIVKQSSSLAWIGLVQY